MEKEFERRRKSTKGSKFKPILFNTEMVKAILEGRKTQTRRLIKLTRGLTGRPIGERGNPDNPLGFMYPCGIKRPPFNKDDVLWVRETWCDPCPGNPYVPIVYKADMPMHFDAIDTMHEEPIDITENDYKWKPSIHMPSEYARIFLRVNDVRVERLQEITPEECEREGALVIYNPLIREDMATYRTLSNNAMGKLWDSTVKATERDRYGWDANPWVWVFEFERCEIRQGG